MRFKSRLTTHPSLESIALTDIVMNLFLFFFVTFNLFSTFGASNPSALKIKLPTVAKESKVKTIANHEIRLAKSGEIHWDNGKITLNELKEKLRMKENKSKLISLSADRDASVQSLVNVLEVVRETGATNVSLQTEIKK